MADHSIGKIFVELDLDPSRYLKGQQQLLKDATQTTLNIEQNFKNLGIKSSAEMDLMRQKITNSYNMITSSAKASENDKLRASEMYHSKMSQLNDQQFGKQTSLIDGLKKNWIAASAIIYASWGTINTAWDMAKAGAAYKEQSGILDNLARKYSTSSDEIVDSMQKASDGLIAKSDLMQIALAGIAKGLKPEQLTNLADAARILGDAVGKDATTALKDLTEALETGRTKGLKTYLGTALDLDVAFGDLTSKMTAAEKTQAMYNITMIAATDLQRQQTKEVDETSDAIERLEAKWKNLKMEISKSLAGVVGAVLGTAEGDEQARLARARIELMKSKDFDYVALSKMSGKNQNAYLDSIIAADNSRSESRFATQDTSSYQADNEALKKSLQARADIQKTTSKAATDGIKAEQKALEELAAIYQADFNGKVKLYNLEGQLETEREKESEDQLKKYLAGVDDAMEAERKKSEAIGRLAIKEKDIKLDAYKTFEDGIKAGYKRMLQYETTWATAGEKIFTDFAEDSKNTLSNVLFDGIKGDLKSFEDYWDSFFDSLLRTFTDTVAEMAMQQVVKSTVSGLSSLGGAVGGAALGYAADAGWLDWMLASDFNFAHSGLYNVGQDQPQGDRLRADEYMRVLQRGEMVLPRNVADGVRSGDYSGFADFMGEESGYGNLGSAGRAGLVGAAKTGIAGLSSGASLSNIGLGMAKTGLMGFVTTAIEQTITEQVAEMLNLDITNPAADWGGFLGTGFGGVKGGPAGKMAGGFLGTIIGGYLNQGYMSLFGGGYGVDSGIASGFGGYAASGGRAMGDMAGGWGKTPSSGDPGGFSGSGGMGGFGDSFGTSEGERYGGIVSGPESGYVAKLHGTELVVSQKRDMPVKMAGGGGVTVNFNIGGNLIGDKQSFNDFAEQIDYVINKKNKRVYAHV